MLSFATVDGLTATADGRSAKVQRAPEIDYEFSRENGAGLERVFEMDSATFLSFAKSMVSVSVFGDSAEGLSGS